MRPQIYDKSGRAVILDTTSLEDDDEGSTFNVDITIETEYAPKFDPSKDVIIRNYSSSLTFSETEAMIAAQKMNKKPQKVIGQTFAGIIESIPTKLAADKQAFPFVGGDRVWGISPSMFGQCWSDYVPVPYKSVFAPSMNIRYLLG